MSLRAAIYGRFSSELQEKRSIDDQVALCRDHAARQGWDVVAVYADEGVSGASTEGRPGFARLLADAALKRFDVALAEDMDRFARSQVDTVRLHEHMEFLGVELHTVGDGRITELHAGLKGLTSALYLKNLALHVRRGQAGRVAQGLAAGGITYGYAAVPGAPGRRTIVAAEAAVVRRIFADYLAGRTPRDIAYALNREGVPPPRGRAWNASTLNGSRTRANGLLVNALYGGLLVWNKVRMVKPPGSNRRLSRPNPRAAWKTAEVPDLSIVDRTVFEAVQERHRARSVERPEHQRRPRHLLSGLLRCAACGSGLSTNGKDRSGRIRIRCTAHAENGTCPDPQTFYLAAVERAVLAGLAGEMRKPVVIAETVRAFHAEWQRLTANEGRDRARIERRLGENTRESERAIDAIVKGIGDAEAIGRRSKDLAAERARLEAELAALPQPDRVIALHPGVLKRYEEQLGQLQDMLARGITKGDSEAAEALRELVESVTVRRDPTRHGGVRVEIAGRLESLLGRTGDSRNVPAAWGTLVAEERYSRSPRFNIGGRA